MSPIPYIEYITTEYGKTTGRSWPSRGISVAPGGMPFPSWVAGWVIRSHYNSSLGNVVVVENELDGYNVLVAHLDSRSVALGQRVEVGDVLGIIGSTGTGCVGRCAYIAVIPSMLQPHKTIDPVPYSRELDAKRGGHTHA